MGTLFEQQQSGYVGVAAAAPKPAVAEILENPIPEQAQLPSVVQSHIDSTRGTALADLREHALASPVHVMEAALTEFEERRKFFRDWLLQRLKEGTHFGYPPGCLPQMEVREGVKWFLNRGSWYPEKQWSPKPSFYQAGADFVADLMGLRCEYKADLDAWQQGGSNPGMYVFACYLYSRSTGQLIGEGRGGRKFGDKGGDLNNAIKMAKKAAKVAAILDAYGLRDLFTQDLEDGPPPPMNSQPEQKPNATKAQPRGQRPDKVDLESLLGAFKQCRPPSDRTPEAFAVFASHHTGIEYTADTVTKLGNWTKADISKCRKALEDGQ